MTIALSLIIPAYDESTRLPPFLASVRSYLDGSRPGDYEVIVVDDGSQDGLPGVLGGWAADWPELRVVRHPANRGKGAAVRTGMMAARGELLLFADADGATPIDQEAGLAGAIAGGADVAVGSRLLASPGVTRRRTALRGVIGRLFAAVARRWLGVSVRDPQCGFKMFRHEAGRRLFSLGRESGFLFDLELLALAARLGYCVAEVPVDWTEVPGGHMRLAAESGRIVRQLWRLRRQLASTEIDNTTP